MGTVHVHGKRVLVADDELGVREAIKLLLSIDEHAVSEAENGAAALEMFRSGTFDLVITDYEMPRMKGDELAARIRASSPRQPIIMITAYTEKLQPANGSVNAFLHKPFEFNDLRLEMSRLLS